MDRSEVAKALQDLQSTVSDMDLAMQRQHWEHVIYTWMHEANKAGVKMGVTMSIDALEKYIQAFHSAGQGTTELRAEVLSSLSVLRTRLERLKAGMR